MKKKNFYSELAYIAGMLLLPLGIVFMEKANLGLSTVAAPAYLLFRKISPVFSFYTFGTSEFCLQVMQSCLVGTFCKVRVTGRTVDQCIGFHGFGDVVDQGLHALQIMATVIITQFI
jgi:hypothetical protein